jgi:hypothetical protein
MKCPNCGENTPDNWAPFWPDTALTGEYASRSAVRNAQPLLDVAKDVFCHIEYMRCANSECQQMVIRFSETRVTTRFLGGVPIIDRSGSMWVIYPRHGQRSVDPLVPEPMRGDYAEAASILDLSPRMSAVLSRRILADLLEQYAGRSEFRLGSKLKAFSEDTRYSADARRNAQSLNEIADFGAHTQKDDQAEIINVDRHEAEWTLDFLERLFDLLIITPARDKAMRDGIEQKRRQAGRAELPPLPEESQDAP